MAFEAFEDVAKHLPYVIDDAYNKIQLHFSLGYSSAKQFAEDAHPADGQISSLSLSVQWGAVHNP